VRDRAHRGRRREQRHDRFHRGAVQRPWLILRRHERNKGRCAALRTAASLATGTHLLPFDADLEYAPGDIAEMLIPVIKGRVLTHLVNVLFNSYLSDMQTGLKLMPVSTFNHLALSENGSGLDTEITATLLRLGVRPFEVPVSYYSRPRGKARRSTDGTRSSACAFCSVCGPSGRADSWQSGLGDDGD
jgi:glycosyltransferase involved in cell wall biosynthesis